MWLCTVSLAIGKVWVCTPTAVFITTRAKIPHHFARCKDPGKLEVHQSEHVECLRVPAGLPVHQLAHPTQGLQHADAPRGDLGPEASVGNGHVTRRRMDTGQVGDWQLPVDSWTA